MGLTRNYATAIKQWLDKFAPTYRQPVVYDDNYPIEDDHIEYSADVSNFATEFIQSITIYTKSTGFNKLMDIVDNIEQEIGENGTILRFDWGYITIYKGSPFYQDKPDEDESIRAGYINLLVKIYQKL